MGTITFTTKCAAFGESVKTNRINIEDGIIRVWDSVAGYFKQVFLLSLPGDTQAEKAEFLGIRQAALSLWVKRSSTIRREAILLEGWSMLTDEQRARAMGE